jgi:hypothetical protein
MKYVTKLVLLNGVTLLMSCYTVPNAAQTIIAPTSYAIAARQSVTPYQNTGGGAVAAAFFTFQSNSLAGIQLGNHGGIPGDSQSLTQGVCSTAALHQDKDPQTSSTVEDAIVGTNSSLDGDPTRNDLRSQGLKYFSHTEQVSPAEPRTVTQSFDNTYAKEYFEIIQTPRTSRNQMRQFDGLNTEAWTTSVGWHSCGAVVQDPSTYEAKVDPMFLDGVYQ